MVRSTPYHGDMAQNTVRRAPVDVVGSRPAPSAFQAPRVTPLETPSLPANPAAGKPSVAPRGYQGGDYRPLAELIPRRRGHREPHDPFSTQAGLTGPRVEHRDPHEPIRTSRLASGSSTWAAPAGDPVSTVPPPRLKTVRMPRRLDPRMPATAGSRSIMDLCRALGWPWIVVLALGCVWSPLSIPALLLACWTPQQGSHRCDGRHHHRWRDRVAGTNRAGPVRMDVSPGLRRDARTRAPPH